MIPKDAIDILKDIQNNLEENDFLDRCALDMAIDALEEKRPHGEWIDKGEYAECSICGGCSGTQFDGVEPIPLKTNFCPNCGADMTKRGLRAKMGLIDDAPDAKPDLEYIKIGDIIYTQDDDKQGWTGREENK